LHHYRRHEEVSPPPGEAPVQKITAGGGGAFLHATHDEDVARIVEEATRPGAPSRVFDLKTAYPDLRRSWYLSFGNLLSASKNPKFGILPALLYLFTAWIVGASVGFQEPVGALQALRLTGLAVVHRPGLAVWMLAVVAVFLVFTDTHSKTYRVAAGLTHAVVHWVCIFYLGWGALIVAGWLLPGQSFRALHRECGPALQRRVDRGVHRDGSVPADLAQRLRPPRRAGSRGAQDRGFQELPAAAHRA
jgi:hypothetical protein